MKKIQIKKKIDTLIYICILILAFSFPISLYPNIYGDDGMVLIWMAKAIKNGALFSSTDTWLISPLSYLGFYPYSHYPVGIPIFLSLIISVSEILSLPLEAAILFYDLFFLSLIFYQSISLSKIIFKEKWSQIIFTASILLSPNVLFDLEMTISSRIVITLVVLVLIKISLKYLTDSIKKSEFILKYLFLTFLAIFIHRIWVGSLFLFPIIFFTKYIIKKKKFHKILIWSIIPICTILFCLGFILIEPDPRKIVEFFGDNSNIISLIFNLFTNYLLQFGLIFIFFPLGFVGIVMKFSNENRITQPKQFYIILITIPFFFIMPNFYAKIIFQPTVIIISVYGMKYIKTIVSKHFQKFDNIFDFFILFISIMYSIFYVNLWYKIDLTYISIISFVILGVYVIYFSNKILNEKYHNKIKNIIPGIIRNINFKEKIGIFIIICSIFINSTTTILGRINGFNDSSLPWENRHLVSDEEYQIVDFFNNEKIDGIILINSEGMDYSETHRLERRLSAIGFLPVFCDRLLAGRALYYGILSPNEVHDKTVISFSTYLTHLTPFILNPRIRPIRELANKIEDLNVSIEIDKKILELYKVQYLITIDYFLSGENNTSSKILYRSLYKHNTPVFSTDHFKIWKIYDI